MSVIHRAAPPDEAELIALFRARDESAIERCTKEYGSYLRTVAFNILGNEDDCEECINDVMLALWERPPQNEDSSLRAYAASILRRKAFSRLRAGYAQKRGGSQMCELLDGSSPFAAASADDTESAFDRAELARVINLFIGSLNKEDRYIFISRYYEARTAEQIGAELGISGSAVFKRLNKLKLKLKNELERNGYQC